MRHCYELWILMVLYSKRPDSPNLPSKNLPLSLYSQSSVQRPNTSTRNPNPEGKLSLTVSTLLPLTSSTSPLGSSAASSQIPSSPFLAPCWSSNPHSKDPTRNSYPFSSRVWDSSFATLSRTTMRLAVSLPPRLTLLLRSQ